MSFMDASDHTLDKFEYRKLSPGYIRLLEFFPYHGSIGLRFLVNDFAAHQAPPYTAISYQWGNGSPNTTIYLNGKSFRIRANLYWCLHYACQFSGWRYFWADAICINQMDVSERNEQVQLMDKIYAHAACVMVWTGLPKRDLARMSPNYELTDRLVEGAAEFDKYVEGGIAQVATRPYWSRMWVVQEFMLAKEILIFCGRYYVSWERFQDVVSLSAGHHLEESGSALANISPFILSRYKRRYERKAPLFDLILRYRRSQCTEPVDRIFSMLSLLSPEERKSLKEEYGFPNYNLSIDEVLIRTLAYFYQGGLDVADDVLSVFDIYDKTHIDRLRCASNERTLKKENPDMTGVVERRHFWSLFNCASKLTRNSSSVKAQEPEGTVTSSKRRLEATNEKSVADREEEVEVGADGEIVFNPEGSYVHTVDDEADDNLYQMARSEVMEKSLEFDLQWQIELMNAPRMSSPLLYTYLRFYYNFALYLRRIKSKAVRAVLHSRQTIHQMLYRFSFYHSFYRLRRRMRRSAFVLLLRRLAPVVLFQAFNPEWWWLIFAGAHTLYILLFVSMLL